MTIRPNPLCAFCGRKVHDLDGLQKRQYCKGKPCKELHKQFVAKYKKK